MKHKKVVRVPVTDPKEVPQYRSSTSGLPSEPKAPGFIDRLIDDFYEPADVFAELDDKPVSPRGPTQASSSSSMAQRQSLPQTIEVGATCPACGSFRHTVRTSRINKAVSMKLPSGEMHRGVQFQYRNCLDCPQKFVVRRPV